ncbi:MAG: hypothetical protein LBJ93_01505 [Clostridiales bacterium]|jgi:hypothetical protein|nr:hypothetical protein [Clostridiales bacterium]
MAESAISSRAGASTADEIANALSIFRKNFETLQNSDPQNAMDITTAVIKSLSKIEPFRDRFTRNQTDQINPEQASEQAVALELIKIESKYPGTMQRLLDLCGTGRDINPRSPINSNYNQREDSR